MCQTTLRTQQGTAWSVQHLPSIEGARNRIRQLKKGGELKEFQVKEVLGGEEKIARKERNQTLLDEAKELLALARTPLREIFRA